MDSWGRCGQNDCNRRATEREGGGWSLECYMSLWHIIGKHRIYLPSTVLSLLLSFPRQAVITPLTHTSDAKYTHLHLQEMCSNELPVKKRVRGRCGGRGGQSALKSWITGGVSIGQLFLKMWGQVVLFNPRWRAKSGSADCRRGLMF